jgi:hypothetical protein
MAFEIEAKTLKWLLSLQIISQADVKQLATSTFEIKETISNLFENGIKISLIVQ